jgi:oxygen-independent coproporphyrinogen-3 oxidase
MREFVDRVLSEADQWTVANVPNLRPQTAFFGGGTPSLLPEEQMSRLLAGLRERFDFSELSEWTVEVNPATASLGYFQMLASHGVNRISLGAQSFDRQELALLERHHNPEDVPQSLKMAQAAGFKRLNIDLIYAIPGQTMDSWQRSLEAAIDLGLRHYSCYGLTYESNTAIAVRKRLGEFQPVADELELEMLHYTRRRLADAGCPAYEISNYAAAGEQCRHNLLYWNGGSYIGLGPSAASHVQGHRFRNRPHLGEWESAIDAGRLPATDVETLTPLQRAGERVMLQLRLTRGIDFDEYAACTGYDARTLYRHQIDRLDRLGLIEVDNSGLRLSRTGLNVADAVAAEFLVPHD